MKIYTKAGDDGQTGLIDGSRVGKDDLRVAAYGDLDEVNAVLGVVLAHVEEATLRSLLLDVQRDLFALGAQLADPQATIATRKVKAAVSEANVERLEQAIDDRQERLAPLTAFILPGGTPAGAFLHLARTACRRAERSVVTLHRAVTLDPLILVYVNRLSDLLFVLARSLNQEAGRAEDRW